MIRFAGAVAVAIAISSGCTTDSGSGGRGPNLSDELDARLSFDASPEPDAAPPPPPPTFAGLHLSVSEAAREAVALALPSHPRVTLEGERPVDAALLEVEVDPDCRECFALTVTERGVHLRGGLPLGLAHGLAEALEHAGFGLEHPLAGLRRAELTRPLRPAEIWRDEPAIGLRGLHLHTLHPIEALNAYWIPGREQLDRARRINQWSALNGANFIEWVALGDIQRSPEKHAAWIAHTREVLADAHARGLKVGLGIQLFGASNLQKAFDLVDDPEERESPRSAQIGAALDLITPVSGLDFDLYNLSFGEFSGADPELFVDSVNLTWQALQARAPNAQMVTTIHVGNAENLRVTYRGQEMLYYFLVQFADPAVVPWVHTVMFYNLYDPAGGAYLHPEFSEHRAFVEDRLRSGAAVGYFPETAYWIAFDDSVPQFLPVYITSRLLDLDRLRPQGALNAHVLFSSGWEWGYWMHDRAALRASYRGRGTPAELFAEAYADEPIGEALATLGEAQRRALILGLAAPYTAGRDLYIDAGDRAGIIAAPDRLSLAEVAALEPLGRARFAAGILTTLRTLQTATAAALRDTGVCPSADTVDPAPLSACRARPAEDPLRVELADGLAIDWLRLVFVQALYGAALAVADDDSATSAREVSAADAALAQAQTVIHARHAALWDHASPWLTQRWGNPTIYGYGYLFQPDSLCHWRRERNQLARLLTGGAPADPNCAL